MPGACRTSPDAGRRAELAFRCGYPIFGIVQIYALVFGIAYLAVAVLEVAFGGGGLKIGGTTILRIQLVQNIIHWIVGLAVLGSFFAGENVAKWWLAPSA
jgi:hypothetical protein